MQLSHLELVFLWSNISLASSEESVKKEITHSLQHKFMFPKSHNSLLTWLEFIDRFVVGSIISTIRMPFIYYSTEHTE